MSLRPDDRSSRSRDKSKTRDRSRSRSNVRAPRVPSPPSNARYEYAAPTGVSSTMPGSFSNAPTPPTYEVRSPEGASAKRPSYFPQTSSDAPTSRYPPTSSMPYPSDAGGYTMGNYTDLPPNERPGYVSPQAQFPAYPRAEDDDLLYGTSKPTREDRSRQQSYSRSQPPPSDYPSPSADSYHYTPREMNRDLTQPSSSYQYNQLPDRTTYSSKPITGVQTSQYDSAIRSRDQLPGTYPPSPYDRETQYVEVAPSYDKTDRKSSTSRHRPLSLSTQQPSFQALPPADINTRMDRLSVSGLQPGGLGQGGSGNMPPPSPLLEAYRGTYQSIAPMPLDMRSLDDDDLDNLPPLSAPDNRTARQGRQDLDRDFDSIRNKKSVKVYDPAADARAIASALNHHKVDAEVIIDIIPGLSHDQIFELRRKYKEQVKIQGKGINLPKHLKMKLTGNFGKAVYVTALGRWESEGYWANFWYQAHGSRRELLIESLMGRTNAEIRNIKDEFRDKRYNDSLTRCMEKELKMDKFRTAVLMVLEERRQEEQDVYPAEYRSRDVEILHRALTARQGGESAMLEIIIRRSDAHLREVLRLYERMYGENFARAALKKSNNLVGEVIAHILNGVINKPARDALLLQHAIQDIAAKNKDDELRYELLISRLIRMHWDKMHLTRVRREYAEKFRRELQEDIEEATKGDLRDFLCEICQWN